MEDKKNLIREIEKLLPDATWDELIFVFYFLLRK